MTENITKKTRTKNITVTIDGKRINVPIGATVLQSAQKAGIYIPTLCYLENLKPYGGCRLCIVEIKNMSGYPIACTTPVAENMEIITNTPALQSLRREIFELILSEHPYTCLVCKEKQECKEYMTTTRKVTTTTGCNFCPNNGKCEIQKLAEYFEITDVSYPITYKGIPLIKDNPFYEIDYNLCVLCGRCVRICNEERYSETLAFVNRGSAMVIGTAFGESYKDAGCEYCGACVDVCPTSAITEKIGKWAGLPHKSITTTCSYCPVACELNINIQNNAPQRIINIGRSLKFNSKSASASGKLQSAIQNSPQICVRGKFTIPDLVHHPERIKKPLIKKKDTWVEVSWEEAISYTATNFERYRGNQFGLIGSAQDTLENNYILQKFSRKVMRSNNVDLFPSFVNKDLIGKIHNYYCVFSPVEIDFIPEADAILIIGSQAYLSHPIIENKIRKAFRNGKRVIVANSHYNRTSEFATQNIFYQTGKEYAFLLTLFGSLVKERANKVPDELKNVFENFDFAQALEKCSVSKSDIEQILKSILSAKKLIIIAGDGVLRHPESENNFNILFNIQQLLNNCKILFLLNESSAYGGALVGMHPDYLPNFDAISEEKNINKWSDNWKTKLSNIKGLSADEMVNKVAEDGITALLVIGDIPPHHNLANLKFFVQQNLFFTETTKYANVFLPLTHFTEIDGHIINIEHKLRELNGVISPIENVKPVWFIISKIAEKMFEKGFSYEKIQDIFSELLQFSPSQTIPAHPLTPSPREGEQKVLPFGNACPDFMSGDLGRANNQFPIPIIIENNYFHYFGNILSALIPDMKQIRDEGVLNISAELAEQQNIKNDETVQLTTEFGKATLKAKILPELNGHIVYFKPNWEHINFLSNGLNIEKNYIFAGITKKYE